MGRAWGDDREGQKERSRERCGKTFIFSDPRVLFKLS